MGRFIYDSMGPPWEMDDRILLHLQSAVTVKFRRHEAFMLNFSHAELRAKAGTRSFWMHPSIPMQFYAARTRAISLNTAWVEQLVNDASRPDGLWLTPEPTREPREAIPR